MKTIKRYGKLILFDTLAVLCFIGVILFAWLPGPGGIPLFIAGLSLLAANHEWAERWLETAKHKGKSFKNIIFPDNGWVKNTYDILSISIFGLAVYTAFTTDNRFIFSAGLAVAMFGFFIFLINRDRFDKITALFKRKK